MSELIQQYKYKRMINSRKKTIIKKLKEIKQIMIRYGTMPYMMDVEQALKVVGRIE